MKKSSVRAAAWMGVLALLSGMAVSLASCSSEPPALECNSLTCGGCCTAEGRCEPGTSDRACGSVGGACVSCAGGLSCQVGVCVEEDETGDGGARPDAGASPDGGSADGGELPDGGSQPDGGELPDGGSQPDGGGLPDGGDSQPAVRACRERIQARTAELQRDGVDVGTWPFTDAPEMAEPATQVPQTRDTYREHDGRYRPLTNHPGCVVGNLYYDKANTSGTTPYVDGNNDGKWTGNAAFGGPNAATGFIDGDRAQLPGYPCAAREYTQPDEDTSKPIVILVHTNSTRPHAWEKFLLPEGMEVNTAFEGVQFSADITARDQLAEKLIAARYRVIAVDFRTDVVTNVDPAENSTTQNAPGNVDHGWATPILQSLVKAVMRNHPGRKVSLVGHGLGATVARDALRRLYVEWTAGTQGAINPFVQLRHVVLAAGANHGISTYDPGLGSLCANNDTMRGTVVCELGSRSNYVQTYFHKPLNGPRDLFSTPCADGDYAFGRTGQCGGNVVRYLTLVVADRERGQRYQDLYGSEASARLDMEGCVENRVLTLNDHETSGYFNKGFIATHFGPARGEAGMALILSYLAE